MGYSPEEYWSEVADRIDEREADNVIAGDDEPYYRYKRQRFLQMLNEIDFNGRSVLEIGFGPGGNLGEVWTQGPARLAGADISSHMVALAGRYLPAEIELYKINGTELPFPDRTFDIVFTATVLQHNTDEKMLGQIVSELARVSARSVYLFERIENTVRGDELCCGRPVAYYAGLMERAGFELVNTEFSNIRVSYYLAGATRKLLNSSSRREGEPLSGFSLSVQRLALPLTRVLDKIFTSRRDLAHLEFRRKIR